MIEAIIAALVGVLFTFILNIIFAKGRLLKRINSHFKSFILIFYRNSFSSNSVYLQLENELSILEKFVTNEKPIIIIWGNRGYSNGFLKYFMSYLYFNIFMVALTIKFLFKHKFIRKHNKIRPKSLRNNFGGVSF